MQVYQIGLYDQNWKILSIDYGYFEDRQQAKLKAEKDADWLGAEHWEIIKIR